jgi:nucleotide-binding universal stress UspA family protein
MLKRILVGLGGTEYATAAINQAMGLALAHDAEVSGVSILDEAALGAVGPVPLGAGHYARQLAEDLVKKAESIIEQSIDEFVEASRAAGVRHQIFRESGEPLSLMTRLARYHDLMVFGLRSLFEFDIVPDSHDALMRLVQAGVRPLIAVSRGYYPVQKVLIAYSGSMESAKAMKHFVQMRLWPDATVRITTFDDKNPEAPQLLADASEYCRAHSLTVETELLAGSPKEQLLPYAESWGADLTVIGNSAKKLLLRRIFGETALHVIRNADRPLFLAQ